MEQAPDIDLGGKGRLVYDKKSRTIVGSEPSEKDRIRELEQRLQERTTERDYRMREADLLAEIIRALRPALKEAERFMSYFAGEAGGSFVGPGTPKTCLEQIRKALDGERRTPLQEFDAIIAALCYDGSDENSLTVGEIRRALP